MAKQLKIKVPEILKEKGLDIEDLRWGARLSLNTAKRWANEDEAQQIEQLDKDTLVNIAEYLNVKIDDLLEIVDEELS
jgi:DNA-binding Xre family transcriptional regulator